MIIMSVPPFEVGVGAVLTRGTVTHQNNGDVRAPGLLSHGTPLFRGSRTGQLSWDVRGREESVISKEFTKELPLCS